MRIWSERWGCCREKRRYCEEFPGVVNEVLMSYKNPPLLGRASRALVRCCQTARKRAVARTHFCKGKIPGSKFALQNKEYGLEKSENIREKSKKSVSGLSKQSVVCCVVDERRADRWHKRNCSQMEKLLSVQMIAGAVRCGT